MHGHTLGVWPCCSFGDKCSPGNNKYVGSGVGGDMSEKTIMFGRIGSRCEIHTKEIRGKETPTRYTYK